MEITAELIERLREGEEEAWASFFNYANRLVRVTVQKMGLSQEDADDITMESVATVYCNLRSGKVRDPSKLRAYWVAVARNQVRNHGRKRRELVMPLEELEGLMHQFDQSLLEAEQTIVLEQCWDEYAGHSEAHRIDARLFWSNRIDLIPIRQLEAEFGIPKSKISRKILRVQQALKSCMQRKFQIEKVQA